jgi:hypothetical protein
MQDHISCTPYSATQDRSSMFCLISPQPPRAPFQRQCSPGWEVHTQRFLKFISLGGYFGVKNRFWFSSSWLTSIGKLSCLGSKLFSFPSKLKNFCYEFFKYVSLISPIRGSGTVMNVSCLNVTSSH